MPNVSIPQLLFVVVAGGLLTQALLLLAQGQGAVLQRNYYNFWSWLTGAPRQEGFWSPEGTMEGADVANAYVTQYTADSASYWHEPPAGPAVETSDYDPTDYAVVPPPPPPPPAVTKLPPAIGIREVNTARDLQPMTPGPAASDVSVASFSDLATFGSPI
jgi:hypothetical protein